MRTKYYAGAGGRRFFYDSDATVRCPYAWELPADPDDDRDVPLLIDLEGRVEYAIEPINVFRLMRRAHRSNTSVRHPEQPDTCIACGAKLRHVGYRTWVEALYDDPIHGDSPALTLPSLFGITHRHVTGSERYWPTKREAIQFSREEASIDKQAARA